MRQIKFRGKSQRGYDYSDGDGWIHGSLLQKDNVCAIVKTEDIDLSPKTDDGYSFVEDFGCVPVIPETIGQFTGLVDRNGKKIYEGDILETEQGIAYVIWNDAAFALKSPGSNAVDWEHSSVYEKSIVIGSIHDNPELLNEKQ